MDIHILLSHNTVTQQEAVSVTKINCENYHQQRNTITHHIAQVKPYQLNLLVLLFIIHHHILTIIFHSYQQNLKLFITFNCKELQVDMLLII